MTQKRHNRQSEPCTISPALMRQLITLEQGLQSQIMSRDQPPMESWYRLKGVSLVIGLITNLAYDNKDREQIRYEVMGKLAKDSNNEPESQEVQ